MKRRDVIAGTVGLGVAGLAGCLGLLGLAEHEATPGGVDESVRNDTGYEVTGIDELVVTRNFERAGYEETIEVTNYLTEHDKSVSLGPLGEQRAAAFVVLTTPQVSIAGRDFNPIADYSTDDLVDLVADNYDDVGDVTHDYDESVTILDQETTQSRFEADATFDGHDVPVYMHVSESVQTSEDHLVTIGVYPQEVADSEEANVVAMMEGVVEAPDLEVTPSGDGGDDGTDGSGSGDDGGGGGGDNETDGSGGDNESDDGGDDSLL